MVKLTNLGNCSHYFPPNFPGLEEVVLFCDGEFKNKDIPNSSVWVFASEHHTYIPDILGDDVGCGMAMFIVNGVDFKKAADTFYAYLKGKNILGRGNHFLDICSPISFTIPNFKPDFNKTHIGHFSNGDYTVLLVHSDGKSYDNSLPASVNEAIIKQKRAENFREELGYSLAKLINCKCELVGNWTHNSVESGPNGPNSYSNQNTKIIYRKGCVKVVPEKIHILPAHLGAEVWIYTIDKNALPPYSSMPHATGRSGPRGEKKASLEDAASMRHTVYIPEGISSSSLRSEHPRCYNNFDGVITTLGKGKYIQSLGTIRILSYVGKI